MIIELVMTFIGTILGILGPIIVWPCIFLLVKQAVKEGIEEVQSRQTEEPAKEGKKDGEKKQESGTSMFPLILLIVYTYYPIVYFIIFRD